MVNSKRLKWGIGVAVILVGWLCGVSLFASRIPHPVIEGTVPLHGMAARGILTPTVATGKGAATGIGGGEEAMLDEAPTPEVSRLYFDHVKMLFRKSDSLGEHLGLVRAYLMAHCPEGEALALLEQYTAYLTCDMAMAEAQEAWPEASSPEGIVARLEAIHEFRRASMGDALADDLYLQEMEAMVYKVRREAIVVDSDLYGSEKEARLAELPLPAPSEWGRDNPGAAGYGVYQETLRMYRRDLQEAGDDASRAQLMQALREGCFAPDVAERLHQVDRSAAEEVARDLAYREEEGVLLSNDYLSQEEKEAALMEMQESWFGDEADAFRRREAIARGREQE